ncbi:MAG: hypothetical protein KDB68_09645 [Planctomycetes bacterium]|nr:hypothetical protein [Planctomycetota bacterium]
MRTLLFSVALMLFVALTMVTGCAGYTIERVTKVNESKPGYRFYEPEPYILMTLGKVTVPVKPKTERGLIPRAEPQSEGPILPDNQGSEPTDPPRTAALLEDPKPASKDVWNAELIYLPNKKRQYRVETWARAGKADFEFKFRDGWLLESIGDKSDNSAFPVAAVKAFGDIASSVISTFGGMESANGEPQAIAYLFGFVYDEDGDIVGVYLAGTFTNKVSDQGKKPRRAALQNDYKLLEPKD